MSLRALMLPLLGSWTGTEELGATPWSTAGTARAALTCKLGVGDTAVITDYRQVREDGTELEAHGVLVAAGDTEGEGLAWWVFDTFAQPPVPLTGGWSGPELSLAKTTPRGTARHRFRLDGDVLRYAITVELPGEDAPRPMLRGAYRRVSGH